VACRSIDMPDTDATLDSRAIWQRAERWLPPAILAAAAVAMLIFSWGKWPDVLVDFGHELYVAWQISQGKALVRDFYFSNTGPLSPYLNGLLFWVFGPGLRTLVIFNLLLLGVLSWVLYRLLDAFAGRLAATTGTLAMLVLFAFGQYVGIGNYNYVTPYSHGATHGLLLSLLCLWLAYRYLAGAGIGSLVGASLCFGGVFLTKPEAFIACAAGLLPAAALILRRGPQRTAWRCVALAALLPAALVVCAAFLLLALQLGPARGLRATLLPWILLSTPGMQNPFYAYGLGTDALAHNLVQMAKWSGFYALAFGAAALVDARLPAGRGLRRWLSLVVFALLAGGLVWGIPARAWYDVGRPLPCVALAGAAISLWLLWQQSPETPGASRLALAAMLWLFSAAQLLKMAFNARIYHYGFALAMPAFVVLVATLVGVVPPWLERCGGAATLFRAVCLALLVAVSAAYLQISADYYRIKVFPVGQGADAFLADARGAFVVTALRAISEHAGPGDTLSVIPEGVMINYLARRVNPTPFIEYMPDALAWLGGEQPILSAHKAAPPDLILLVHRDTSEHGATFFGRDYAQDTLAWIGDNYQVVGLIGAPPFRDEHYGMLLLTRKPAPGAPEEAPGTTRP
jgi:hypothetical protein